MDIAVDFHKDHKNWRSRLDFYKDEIRFFFKELNKVFDLDKQNLARMEFIDEYESILENNSKHIEDLLNRIDIAEKTYLNHLENKEMAITHHQLNLDFLKFERSYIEMKQRFKRYASHND